MDTSVYYIPVLKVSPRKAIPSYCHLAVNIKNQYQCGIEVLHFALCLCVVIDPPLVLQYCSQKPLHKKGGGEDGETLNQYKCMCILMVHF